MATGVAGAVVLWMLSGILFDGSDQPPARQRVVNTNFDSTNTASSETRAAVTSVTIQNSTARTVAREIVVSSRSEPNRSVELRAETDGAIVALGAERGSKVATGELIARLDMRDRNARIEEAQALIAQRELQYEAALRLEGQQLISDVQIAEALAQLISARAALERHQVDLAYTTIVAPFDAVLEERLVEIGDYVKSGDTVAKLVDIDPLLIVGEVNERDIADLHVGGIGRARLIGGESLEGQIRYLSPVAAQSTRTFQVELAVPNPGDVQRAGITAELRLHAGEITAHFLSPALLTLDDAGAVGVKAVDDFGQVQYFPVEIVSSSADGIAVTGLPDRLRLITVGQGFVNAGQFVDAVPDPTTAGRHGNELPASKRSEDNPSRL